jgi:hypothetical protein
MLGLSATTYAAAPVLPQPLVEVGVRVEIQGTLRKVLYPFFGNHQWEITAEGRTYVLDLGPSKIKHHLMDGETLLVHGRLQHRIATLPTCGPLEPGKLKEQPLWIHSWAVVADSLQYVSRSRRVPPVSVELRGTLQMKAKVGCPPETLSVVVTDKQTVVVDFGKDKQLKVLAQQLDGKQVMVRGPLTGWQVVGEMGLTFSHRSPDWPVVSVGQLAEVAARATDSITMAANAAP